MKIPFNNLHRQNKSLKKEILEIVENSIESSSFIGGESVKKFENEFKKFTDSCHCISVANGTDALYISLKYLNLSPDDEVIIPKELVQYVGLDKLEKMNNRGRELMRAVQAASKEKQQGQA